MRNGICPKCSSHSIHAARDGYKFGTEAAIVAHIEPGFRGIRPTIHADGVWHFMCVDCGYMESYAADAALTDFVRRNWPAVQAEGGA